MKISTNINSCKRLYIKKNLDELKNLGNMDVHIEIKDGVVTNGLGLDFKLIQEIKEKYNFKVEVQILCSNIENFLGQAVYSGADKITFNPFFSNTPFSVISKIKSKNILCGLDLFPAKSVSDIYYLLDYVDYVNIMGTEHTGVEQKLYESVYEKITQLNWNRNNATKEAFGIQVDGGIDIANIKKIKDAGVDVAVLGKRGLFYGKRTLHENFETAVRALKDI